MAGGKVVDLTVVILKEIRDGVRDGLGCTNTELRRTNERLDDVSSELVKLNGRFDHLLEFSGDRYRAHEERLERIEARVFGTGQTG